MLGEECDLDRLDASDGSRFRGSNFGVGLLSDHKKQNK